MEGVVCINPKCQHKGKRQPLSNFYKRPLSSWGYARRCVDCFQAISRLNTRKRKERKDNFFNTFMGLI